ALSPPGRGSHAEFVTSHQLIRHSLSPHAATRSPDGAVLGRTARETGRVNTSEISAKPESAHRPVSNVPLASRSQPTTFGPIRPPKLPSELMPAIAAAAAVPLMKVEGSGP